MTRLKSQIKNIFVRTKLLSIIDNFSYALSWSRYFLRNKKFQNQNPGFTFPSDYFLYETYKLDYKQYKEDGLLAAREILEWTRKYAYKPLKILEWGCGVARIIRHIPGLVEPGALVCGTDINEKMIEWDTANVPDVQFSRINYFPPTKFETAQFNLIIGFSVLTHIEVSIQKEWLAEIHRILSEKGIFIFTTQGKKYESKLSTREKGELYKNGALTIDFQQKGHRMMSTYNHKEQFKNLVEDYFTVLEFFDGEDFPEKIGGQDLWIVRKKATRSNL